MIFAAGFGTRMAPLTDTKPKPLIEVGGKALLDHALELRAGLGIKRTVVNAHYLAPMIKEHLSGRDVLISEESPDILDTGGGLLAATPLLQSNTVFSLNPDALWFGPNPLQILLEAWHNSKVECLISVVPLARAHGRQPPGDFEISEAGTVSRKGDFVYTGAQILITERLSEVGKDIFSLNEYWDAQIQKGALQAVVYPGAWCDVGSVEARERAEQLWAKHHG
ncbi:MAG: nucleotidyltransferase family protein [Pseudomonadota bacterium]